MTTRITRHTELDVYKRAFDAAMQVFELSKKLPNDERSMKDQIRRSSRSVCANLAEAWRRRRSEGYFISKLNDSEGEAAETQSWLEFCVKCGYVNASEPRLLYKTYDDILGTLVGMIHNADKWIIPSVSKKAKTIPNDSKETSEP